MCSLSQNKKYNTDIPTRHKAVYALAIIMEQRGLARNREIADIIFGGRLILRPPLTVGRQYYIINNKSKKRRIDKCQRK